MSSEPRIRATGGADPLVADLPEEPVPVAEAEAVPDAASVRTLLWTAATERPLDEVACLVELLKRVDGFPNPGDEALRVAALARPVGEIRQLISLLNEPPHTPDSGEAALRAVAVGRPVEDVAQLAVLLSEARKAADGEEAGSGIPGVTDPDREADDTFDLTAALRVNGHPTGRPGPESAKSPPEPEDSPDEHHIPESRAGFGPEAPDEEKDEDTGPELTWGTHPPEPAADRTAEPEPETEPRTEAEPEAPSGAARRTAVTPAALSDDRFFDALGRGGRAGRRDHEARAEEKESHGREPGGAPRFALRFCTAVALAVSGLAHLMVSLWPVPTASLGTALSLAVTAVCLLAALWLAARDTVPAWLLGTAVAVGVIALHLLSRVGALDVFASAQSRVADASAVLAVSFAAVSVVLAGTALIRRPRRLETAPAAA
ncbi:hypothetical protein [Streptomyces sp. HNM0574]|uniref:hypothetical protein n=1 Tax=Streptomyces sp. HNM0574 TaxID=2714954 RepID=UPI001469D563|nr:hypothetical protein [Streptomyces sp. HNM0574]NLU70008.1 hypothetical protein [Streptomyces sp. HNM0574]